MEKPFVYNQNTLEFVQVAAETCRLLEHISEFEREQVVQQLCCLLPLLYLKTRLVPVDQMEELDGIAERFVSEEDYNRVCLDIQAMLGTDDTYLDVFVEDFRYSDQAVMATISENLADIYQEIKDLCACYQTGSEEAMLSGMNTCMAAFHEHWGLKLCNVLRALHTIDHAGE